QSRGVSRPRAGALTFGNGSGPGVAVAGCGTISAVVLRRLRLARGKRGARRAEGSFVQLVGAAVLPAGDWQSQDGATLPITSEPWDERAKAAGCVTVVRTFADPMRGAVVQIRPLASEPDAHQVLSTFPALIDRADRKVASAKVV